MPTLPIAQAWTLNRARAGFVIYGMGANFAALQHRLGGRSGVTLISVSIDPATDTPARLKSWSGRFQAGPGWTLVTGNKNDIDRLLRSLRVYSSSPASHSPIAIIGNDQDGRWLRVSGLLPPDTMAATIAGSGSW